MTLAHNPRIITDGLIMAVDAANPKSYPGTGTTWSDLSGNGHNIELGSSVTLDSNFKGVLNFPEDANGYGRNSTLNLSSSDYTVISFIRKNSVGNDGRTVTSLNNNWLLGHHDTSYGDYYANGWINSGVGTSDTTWRMFTGTGNISSDSYSLYINDSIITNGSNGGSQGPNGWNLNNQYDQYSDCQIANLLCYNRVLSDVEIQQNFNALKGRYGI